MVFAPLIGTALASALLLLASPLLLPAGQRYSADAVIGGVLLAGTVAGFAWLACNRLLLEATPPSPLPALLPAAALVLHGAWRHARALEPEP